MKKFSILVMTFWALVANAQIDNLYSFNTSNQQIVQSAVEKGFVSVSSSYRLQDLKTQKLYGRNGSDAFGVVTSWGIKIEGGFVLLDQAIRPWEHDSNYYKYRGKYNTVPYQLSFTDGDTKKVIDSIDAKPCNAKNILYSIKDTLVSKGERFKVDSSDGEKNGWIVWLTEEKDSSLTYLVFKKKIEFKLNEEICEVEQPNTAKKILAGIYVVPSYNVIGSVSFILCGILVEQNEKWNMVRVLLNSTVSQIPNEEKTEITGEQENEDTDLTPIVSTEKKTKKNKQKE
ncbi:hypothetical protein [uncultured Bacteroides sp.]|uniref:hypothetical protein n=1 Tax=uncultured Bacteroides sp. TaxID=162156 RepID=UPI00262A6A60|nr:hypothetical protein [uncultured Bacteroides sp.]